ncbi:MAG TPA: amino acid ABC transporter permease [Rhizobium sp.]
MDIFNRMILTNLGLLADGLFTTVQLIVLSFVCGIILGVVFTVMGFVSTPTRWLANILVEFFRATPMYVQLVWVAYVWPELFGWPEAAYTAALIALTLQTGAYLSETFRAGFLSIPHGQSESAYALGMTPAWTMRRIIVPQLVMNIVPALINQLVSVVKSSTVVSVIGVADLLYQTNSLINRWHEPVEILTFTALIYIGLVSVISMGTRHIEARVRARLQ